MLNILEPLLLVTAVALAYDYRLPEPLLFGRVELTPVFTLEEQIAEEWLAALRVGPLAPNPGTRVKTGSHRASRRQPTRIRPATTTATGITNLAHLMPLS